MMPKLTLPKLPALGARERLFAAIGMVMIGFVISDKLVVTPWWRHVRQVREETVELQRLLATHKKLLARQSEVDGAMASYQNYVRLARAPEVEMAELIREIEVIGSESGISLGAVTPLPASDNWPYQEYSVDVQYTGSLEQTVRFLYHLESSKKLFELQRVTLGLEKKGSEQVQGTARLVSMAVSNK